MSVERRKRVRNPDERKYNLVNRLFPTIIQFSEWMLPDEANRRNIWLSAFGSPNLHYVEDRADERRSD